MLSELESQGRVRRIRLGAGESAETAIATEDLALFSAVYPVEVGANASLDHPGWQRTKQKGLPASSSGWSGGGASIRQSGSSGENCDYDTAAEEVVRRATAMCGPILAIDLARRLFLPVEEHLIRADYTRSERARSFAVISLLRRMAAMVAVPKHKPQAFNGATAMCWKEFIGRR